MTIKYLAWICCLLLINPFFSFAQANQIVYALEIPSRMSSVEIRQYNVFWEKMASLGLQHHLDITPKKRLIRNFLEEQQSCAFSVIAPLSQLLLSQSPELSLISSDGVDKVGLRVYLPSSDSNITGMFSLESKRVAAAFHLNPSLFLEVNKFIDFKNATNSAQLLKMLYRRRVDAIIAFTPNILLASQRLEFPMPYGTDIWILKDKNVGLVCRDTFDNRNFIQDFNRLLTQLKNSGELRKILGPLADIETAVVP